MIMTSLNFLVIALSIVVLRIFHQPDKKDVPGYLLKFCRVKEGGNESDKEGGNESDKQGDKKGDKQGDKKGDKKGDKQGDKKGDKQGDKKGDTKGHNKGDKSGKWKAVARMMDVYLCAFFGIVTGIVVIVIMGLIHGQ